MVLVDKMAAQISVYFLITRYCFIRCVHATKTEDGSGIVSNAQLA